MRPDPSGGELLLFKAVVETQRCAVAGRLLDDALGAGAWRRAADPDLWELTDAAGARGEGPVAVAATCPLDGDRRVELMGFAVTPALRGAGAGERLLGDLADALRSRGVLTLVAGVPSDHPTDIVVVKRAGFRPWRVARDVVWFDLPL